MGTYGAGLELLNPDGKSFTHFHHIDGDSTSISSDFIVNIVEDREGNLWICSESKGLNLMDKKTHKFTHFLHSETGNCISNNNVNTVFEDEQGNLWIGTMNGLNLYNQKTGQFNIFTTANGLAGDYVFGILQDAKKNLWISTNNGLSHLNPATLKFENYSATDGVQSNEFKQLAVCQASSGLMYFGGINGFNQFYPGNIHRKVFDPPLVITNFTVFNKTLPVEVTSKNPSPLKQSITETKSITLPYNTSVFSFEFASLNYTGTERKRYQYMLDGFDKTWIDAGVARTATYTHLDPGVYTFKVRGLNNQGQLSDNIATIAITITPPFWLTWWFRIAVIVVVAGIIVGIYRYRVNAVENNRKELQKQVQVQTHQLQLAAAEERKARKEAEHAHIETILANAALERSEQRYSTLFYKSPQPKWVYDIDSLQIIQVNNAAMAHYGYSEEDFLGMKVTDLNPADTELKTSAAIHSYNGVQPGAFSGRHQHVKKNGEIIDVEIHSNNISYNNKDYRLFIAVDITEKIAFENTITRAIIKTQEDERYEIGSELHDNICQILACSQMNISMLSNSIPEAMKPFYENTKQYTKQALDEIRNLSHRLAPAFLGEMKLEEVFTRLAASFNVDNKYEMSVYFYDTVNEKLMNRDIQLTIYRILQEQLRNIVKYANATEVCIDVMVNQKNELVMQTSDNGIGFDIANVKNGIGIANMKRRAELFFGKIDFDTAPGRGCSITVVIPLKEKVNDPPVAIYI